MFPEEAPMATTARNGNNQEIHEMTQEEAHALFDRQAQKLLNMSPHKRYEIVEKYLSEHREKHHD